METTLRCHNIVVFGGGSGIGKAIAAQLLSEGATVTLAGRTLSKLENARKELGERNVHLLQWDAADCDSFADRIAQVEEMCGKPDGFVNAAGIGADATFHRGYEPWDITPEEWDIMNDVNYKGAYFLLRNEINYFLDNEIRGNILTIASNAGRMGIIGGYGAAKLSQIEWTHAFAQKYGEKGIIINGIAPGATLTDMIAAYAHSMDQPYPRHAIGRFIHPSETAKLASFLMSDVGVIVTGQTISADGGDKAAYY